MSVLYFQTLYNYNAWANQQVLDSAARLTTAQLQALLFPARASDMIRSLCLDVDQGAPAGIPIWGYFNNETRVMNGYSGIPLIANLYAFGARDIHLEAVKKKMIRAAQTIFKQCVALDIASQRNR